MPALATDGVGGGPEGLMMVRSLEWEMRCQHLGWGWARGSDDGTEPGMGDEMPALATDGVERTVVGGGEDCGGGWRGLWWGVERTVVVGGEDCGGGWGLIQ